MTTAPVKPARVQPLLALENSGFRRLWLSSLQGWSARGMEQAVLGWLMLEMTNSPLQVTLIGFFNFAPTVLFGLFSGALSDRLERKKVLMAGSALAMSATLVIAFLVISGLVRPWQVFGLMLLQGIGWTMDFPARRATARDYLGTERILNGMTLDSSAFNISRIVGPLLGGFLIPFGDGRVAYVVIAIFYVSNFLTLAGLPKPLNIVRAARVPIMKGIAEGIQFSRASQVIMGVLVVSVIMNMLAFPMVQLLPVFTRDVLHVRPELFGILSASQGFGSLIGSISMTVMAPPKRQGLVFAMGSLSILIFVFIFSFSQWYVLSLALFVVSGFGQAAFGTFQSSLVLLGANDQVRGRVLGILMLCIGTSFIGTYTLGQLAENLGAPTATAISAATGIVLMLLVMATNKAMRT